MFKFLFDMTYWSKIIAVVQPILDNVQFAFWASLATAIIRPQETRVQTIKIVLATTILGTLVGMVFQSILYVAPFRFAAVTLVGLYGVQLYNYLFSRLKNPVAFIREIRSGKPEKDDATIQH